MRIYKTGNKADGEEDAIPDWKVPRNAHTLDFPPFAGLAGELAQDPRMREENGVLDGIREMLCADDDGGPDARPGQGEYWNRPRAVDAQSYLNDVVYGGLDGFAYAQSLEEFVRPSNGSVSRSISRSFYPLTHYFFRLNKKIF